MIAFFRGTARTAAALLIAFLLTVLVIWLAHGNARLALTSLASGAFGSR